MTALYAFQPHALPEENQEAMTEALKTVHSMAVTYAVRDSEYDGKALRKGQILGLTENKVTVVTDSKGGLCPGPAGPGDRGRLRHRVLRKRRVRGGGPGHGAADGSAAGNGHRFGDGQRRPACLHLSDCHGIVVFLV